MTVNNHVMTFIVILLLLLTTAFLGCSGGGEDAPLPRPTIEVSPSSYDFGSVTPNNSPAALEIEIQNNGSLALTVSDILLLDTTNFALDLTGGLHPCDTTSSTIPAGDSCTFEVNFTPGSEGAFDAVLTISSDDSTNPTINVPLSGSLEPISELNVRINQVESTEICPNPVVTAYVSVADQGGYPVTTLAVDDFSITEDGGYGGVPTSASFVSNSATLSVALVMDYSTSITSVQDNVDDMETSVAAFVNQLRNDGADIVDEAEIVKFGPDVEVVQTFTSDITALTTAIYANWDHGQGTNLYDAVWQAIDDTKDRPKNRRAVIVVTDGTYIVSSYDLIDVIDYANDNGVPIFTVAIGNADLNILQQLADDTGGQAYTAINTDNLRTIHQQLANVLFRDQFIITYNSELGAGSADLTIGATLGEVVGNDTKEITACP